MTISRLFVPTIAKRVARTWMSGGRETRRWFSEVPNDEDELKKARTEAIGSLDRAGLGLNFLRTQAIKTSHGEHLVSKAMKGNSPYEIRRACDELNSIVNSYLKSPEVDPPEMMSTQDFCRRSIEEAWIPKAGRKLASWNLKLVQKEDDSEKMSDEAATLCLSAFITTILLLVLAWLVWYLRFELGISIKNLEKNEIPEQPEQLLDDSETGEKKQPEQGKEDSETGEKKQIVGKHAEKGEKDEETT